jgi:cytochrome c oxidase cbb3-type subunit 1
MSLVPLMIISINLYSTLGRNLGALKGSAALKFGAFALLAFTLSSIQTIITSVPSGAAALQLTLFTQSQLQLAFVGFFSMAAFGVIYYFVPRLSLKAWPSAGLITAHFWASAIGIAVVAIALAVGGAQQGEELAHANTPILEIVEHLKPFFFARTVGTALFALGQLAFLVNFLKLLATRSASEVSASQLFRPAPSMEVTAQ